MIPGPVVLLIYWILTCMGDRWVTEQGGAWVDPGLHYTGPVPGWGLLAQISCDSTGGFGSNLGSQIGVCSDCQDSGAFSSGLPLSFPPTAQSWQGVCGGCSCCDHTSFARLLHLSPNCCACAWWWLTIASFSRELPSANWLLLCHPVSILSSPWPRRTANDNDPLDIEHKCLLLCLKAGWVERCNSCPLWDQAKAGIAEAISLFRIFFPSPPSLENTSSRNSLDKNPYLGLYL